MLKFVSCVESRAEVRVVKTGGLEHSCEDEGERDPTAWLPCGTKVLLCCQSKGLQVWEVSTGVVVHEWSHIMDCHCVMLVAGDRVAMFDGKDITVWDYTTGVEVLVLTLPSDVEDVALSPNECFIAACGTKCVRVWNIATGECVFEDDSENDWLDVAVSNDIVAAYTSETLCVWSISTGEQLLRHEPGNKHFDCGLAISSCGGVVMYGGDEGVHVVDISHLS